MASWKGTKMVQKRKSTAIRKQQIIEAARKLIVRRGSEHLTVRGLAQEVGFTEAAIYRHFKSKREILLFLMENVTDGMLLQFERNSKDGITSLSEFGETMRLHLSEIEQRKGMSFQIIAEILSLGDKDLNRKLYIKLQIYIDRLQRVLSKGVHSGFIRSDIDQEACATMLFGMIQGLVSMWALGSYKFDLAEKYESIWSIYQQAIQNPSH
jgi:AcrR family transcriptional regulator